MGARQPPLRGYSKNKKKPKMSGVPPRFHTIVASVILRANVDGLLLGLLPIFIISLLSYRPRRHGGGGGGIPGEASRPHHRLPGDPHPAPTSPLPWRAEVACLTSAACIGAGGCWASNAPTHPSRLTPLPVPVRPYQTEKDPGMRPSRVSCTGLPTSCGMASRVLAAAAGLSVTPRRPPIVEPQPPRVGRKVRAQRYRYPTHAVSTATT